MLSMDKFCRALSVCFPAGTNHSPDVPSVGPLRKQDDPNKPPKEAEGGGKGVRKGEELPVSPKAGQRFSPGGGDQTTLASVRFSWEPCTGFQAHPRDGSRSDLIEVQRASHVFTGTRAHSPFLAIGSVLCC